MVIMMLLSLIQISDSAVIGFLKKCLYVIFDRFGLILFAINMVLMIWKLHFV